MLPFELDFFHIILCQSISLSLNQNWYCWRSYVFAFFFQKKHWPLVKTKKKPFTGNNFFCLRITFWLLWYFYDFLRHHYALSASEGAAVHKLQLEHNILFSSSILYLF